MTNSSFTCIGEIGPALEVAPRRWHHNSYARLIELRTIFDNQVNDEASVVNIYTYNSEYIIPYVSVISFYSF